jgi:nitrogen fixation NifU-like protein
MALDQLYQRSILEHNRAPRHFGRLTSPTHSARGVDGLCGDDILIELELVDDTIQRAMFSGEACAVTKASASMMTSWIEGQSRADVLSAGRRFQAALRQPDIPDDPTLGELNRLRAVSSFPARMKNALLPWQALFDALDH